MAAVELKKKNWMFVKKFETWFKKADGSEPRAQTPSQDGVSRNLNLNRREGGELLFKPLTCV